MEFKSQASYQKDKYYDGIKVSTSLDSASFKKHLYILGLNDNLISSSKDNDLIADKYKENLSYLETSYIKDQNKIKNLETLVKLSSNVNLSFSLSDPLNNYSISNLLPNNIKHEHDSNSNLIISEIPNQNFELIGSTYNLNNSASIDKNLAFYAGIHNERANKINENDAFFKYIISQHNYNLTNYISSYTNQFKAKDNTIFKNMFAYNKDGKNFSISHSSLDCYLNDPFDFYCKYVLKLPSKSTPQTLIGTIAHTLIEKRNKSIDFEEEFNSALNKLSDKSLEGYSIPEIKYFAKKAYLNAKNYIIPGIVDFETTTNFKQLFINDGEEFSFNGTVGKRTAANGFKTATVYSNGQVTTDYGGGICQVSSTLYNSVLRANLEITNRTNHTFTVGYVPIGLDATVSWGSPDFKFKNSRNYPIKIVATTANKKLTISVYGLKEDVEYEVELISYKTGTVPYSTVYTTDSSLGKGKTKVVQSGSNGATSVAYKILKLNGKEVSRTLLSKDTYSPHNQIIARGN